ncbi:membrane-bound PQQ-dependent dehydrogenase, glucose/quinate/shikimate family [Rhodospirillum rubrum]|uniref:membrane-bound PQQ-dependent dehydrogenase, glucose/quinate/shikimate family n=1 Tax=Rhodospirillum rubrum TaxID=1085 RepID=UPI001907A200|nr:membrane-bound PQQ-dependent dehydrogenase, glucose/quinate/shikimate family [Rhodospirillum rubrum]MBK1663188.1 membrane-bound PQQ-dependent dehydrogenase, glucose/quinate/shikimate family [Rhodospirillum rubrum]MBK1676991.1 membrane-bound PQQ-dependent dehydrogenase, glucose/quinate/shikimate family [Rhodospirillum rubrum]
MPQPSNRSPLLVVVTGLIGLCGVALVGGGGFLMWLGGSWYYLLAGGALLLTALFLFRARPAALAVYSALILGTLVWALWEAGLDWWPLAARGGVFVLLGLILLLPPITRSLGSQQSEGPWVGRPLAIVLTLALTLAAVSWFIDPHRIDGRIAEGQISEGARGGSAEGGSAVAAGEWTSYGRTAAGMRYSPLAQITPANAASLEMAWEYHTGDFRGRPGDPVETTFEATPLKIGDGLYFCTPHQSVLALDAESGARIWSFDPEIPKDLSLQHLTCRGLSYHRATGALAAGEASADGSCDAKLFMPTADGRLIALDPATGKRCAGFGGAQGEVDLWQGMPNVNPGSYYSTSPPVVTERLVIIGGTVLDNVSTKEASGVIRAYDVNTGTLVWRWDSAEPEATQPLAAGQTYTQNSPNSWSILSVDEALGLVYVPMGNQPPDQWGGDRTPAVERYSSAVVALDVATGQVRWSFQTVHHDLWDYDVPAQPSLVDLTIDGARVPALVQATKQGEIFVLDRRDGTPILPVTERRAPQGAASGDHTAPTQPVSALSYEPEPLTGADMWGVSLFDQLACRIALKQMRYDGRYTPPSEQGSLIYPGNFGVFNWGGVAVDPEKQVVFSTPANLAFVSRLVPRADDTSLYIHKKPAPGDLPTLNENFGAPYAVSLSPFTSVLGLPCQRPPWGFVSVADLTTGKIVWMHKNGTVRDLAPLPLPFPMGVPSLGGPIVTAGGVAFLSGTLDYYLRAYDLATGEEIWKSRLPAGGQATPMTYEGADGRQYVLVVAGGHGSLGTKAGDSVIAYALPKR